MRNNPVQIALDEAVSIWGADPANPDIVLSLGTGIQVDASGGFCEKKNMKLEALKITMPGRWRKMIDTGLDMVASTLNCQREWDNFTRAHHDGGTKLHRLNVGLEDSPPKLDNVGSMASLREASQKYVHQDTRHNYPFAQGYTNAYLHIEAVARRLIASLFYISEEINGPESVRKSVIGFIHCRLPPNTAAAVMELVSAVRFRLVQQPKIYGATDPVYTEIRFQPQEFSRETMAIPVSFKLMAGSWKRSIEVQISRRSPVWTGISGF